MFKDDKFFHFAHGVKWERFDPPVKAIGILKVTSSHYSINLKDKGVERVVIEQGEGYAFTDRERVLSAARLVECELSDSDIINKIGDFIYPELTETLLSDDFAIVKMVLNGVVIPVTFMQQSPRSHGKNGGCTIKYSNIHNLMDPKKWEDYCASTN